MPWDLGGLSFTFRNIDVSFGPACPDAGQITVLLPGNASSAISGPGNSTPCHTVSISEAKKQRRELINALPGILTFLNQHVPDL